MLRSRRLLAPACRAGLLLALATPWWGVLPAVADRADGVLTVSVVLDTDGDGEYDAGVDQPVAGAVVTVTDAAGTAVSGATDDQGRFVLEPDARLTGGRYFVTTEVPADTALVALPASRTFAPPTAAVDLTAGRRSVRFGLVRRGGRESATPTPDRATGTPQPSPAAAAPATPRFAVQGRVWRDLRRTGEQDDTVPPVTGVGVQLLDDQGAVVASTATGPSGRYRFDDLPAGTYAVRFAGIPADMTFSPSGVGSAGRDSDPDATGTTAPFALGVGAPGVRAATATDGVEAAYVDDTVDAGLVPLRYAVASAVWQDTDRDGVQDPGEPPGQARVVLLDGAGGQVAATRTDAQGRFLIDRLRPGRYRLRFDDLGAHRALTVRHVGDSASADSDPDPRTRTTGVFRLQPGAPDLIPAADFGGTLAADYVNTTLGAGTVGSYTVSEWVWRDDDGDGVRDPGEGGVGGVRVELLGSAGAVVASTSTRRDGRFVLDGVPAGRYRLRLTVPPGLRVTVCGRDSDVAADATSAPITLDDDHPAETTVAAGLAPDPGQMSAPAASGGSPDLPVPTAAPGAASVTPTASTPPAATAPRQLAGDQGMSLAVPVAGVGVALLGSGLLAAAWVQRRT